MNTLLLIILIIIVIVGYPFYMHIVEIFRATAWMTILSRTLKSITQTQTQKENEEIKK